MVKVPFWQNMVQYNSHQCRICGYAFDKELKEKYNSTQLDKGHFTKMHRLVVKHFKANHPEYEIK
jgi:hypothetical protein